MQFTVDDGRLEARIELDTEHEDVDLTAGGLGEAILAAAAQGMVDSWWEERAPDGTPWAALRPSTVRHKPGLTGSRIGVVTGSMLDPARITAGPREVDPRWATLGYHAEPGRDWGKAHGFHNGRGGSQEARPLLGWTERARAEAKRLIEAADFDARS